MPDAAAGLPLDGIPWEAWGVLGVVVAVVGLVAWVSRPVLLALVKRPEPVTRGPSAKTLIAEINAKRTDETQDERIALVERRLEECFAVEGKHRAELLEAIRELRLELRDTRRKADGCATSIATLEGMIRAKAGGSGITAYVKPDP